MICIDSDCIIDFLAGEKEAVDILNNYKDEVVTTEVNAFEVFLGIYASKDINKKHEETAEAFFKSVEVINISGWGIKAAKIFAKLMRQGRALEQNDCLIAAIALANGCNSIITRNAKHFSRIEGIKVICY